MMTALCFLLGVPATIQETPPISEREHTLLMTLIAAQEALESAFPEGSLRAVAEERIDNSHRRADVYTVWSGDRHFVEATYVDTRKDSRFGERVSDMHLFRIRKPGEFIALSVDSNLLQVDRAGRFSERRDILQLRPDNSWFSDRPGGTRWSELLRRFIEKHTDDYRLTVREVSDEIVEVRRTYIPTNGTFECRFAMSQGGNVIGFSSDGPGERIRERGKFEWTDVGDGRWFLKSYRSEQALADDPDFERASLHHVEVTEFDVSPQIPPNRFERSSLPVTPGMEVVEYGATERRYRVADTGEPEAGVSEEAFEELAEQLRSQGFADPSRRAPENQP